ncbi:glycosyltransferase family 4 protein [Streptomyces sp. NPDC058486]|uniref:glycosyltransferase family 4 protein n=1 Tax=unclassified Streptomyces TaxID=2593676 RepID=UPI0036586750
MTRAATPFLVAVSGPDGVARTTLVHRLAPMLREHGLTVVTAPCDGCVLCRRRYAPARWRNGSGDRSEPGRSGRALLDRVHGSVDAAELSLRVAAARRLAALRSRGRRPAVVVTDRGPLDGLAAFDPSPGTSLARRLRRLADRCDLTLLLEPDVVSSDAITGTRPDGTERRYRRWADDPGTAPVRLRPGPTPSATAGDALRLVRDRLVRAHLPRTGPTNSRPRVVLSVFDDLGNANYRGGGAVVVGEIARRLAEEFDVTVVTAGARGGVSTDDRVTYRRLPVCRAGPRAGQLLFQALLPLVARRVPHDLWLESFTPPFSTSFLPLFTRAPVVGIDQVRSGDAMWRKYHIPFFLVERIGLRFYRDLVVLNDADAATVRRFSPRADVEVIPNGVAPRPDGERTGDGGFVLFLGRVDLWQKGIDLLLEAHARADTGLPLVLAGSGTKAEEHRLDLLLAERGRDGEVRRLGHVTGAHKERLLADCAFVVMPSRHETFGLVALEAMAHGKPVLHFDLPALRWTRIGGSVPVPAYDVDALAQAMRRLTTDSPWRRRLGEDALATSRAFSWSRMTDRYLSLARRLLDGAPPSPVPSPSPPPSPREVSSS